MKELLRMPSAWLPLALSLAMLAFIVVYVALYGIAAEPQQDEGTPARIFQLWLVFEFFAIGYFATRYLPSKPREAIRILALQVLLVFIPFVIVWMLEHGMNIG